MSDIQSHAYYDLSVYPSRISSTLETELTTDNWHIFLILYGSYVNTCCCVELWGRLVVSWAYSAMKEDIRDIELGVNISFDVVIHRECFRDLWNCRGIMHGFRAITLDISRSKTTQTCRRHSEGVVACNRISSTWGGKPFLLSRDRSESKLR